MVDLPPKVCGYTAKDKIEPALSDQSDKRRLFEQLRSRIGRLVKVTERTGYNETPLDFETTGTLVDCMLVPASEGLHRWPVDEFARVVMSGGLMRRLATPARNEDS